MFEGAVIVDRTSSDDRPPDEEILRSTWELHLRCWNGFRFIHIISDLLHRAPSMCIRKLFNQVPCELMTIFIGYFIYSTNNIWSFPDLWTTEVFCKQRVLADFITRYQTQAYEFLVQNPIHEEVVYGLRLAVTAGHEAVVI